VPFRCSRGTASAGAEPRQCPSRRTPRAAPRGSPDAARPQPTDTRRAPCSRRCPGRVSAPPAPTPPAAGQATAG